jgi:hypothetical protein
VVTIVSCYVAVGEYLCYLFGFFFESRAVAYVIISDVVNCCCGWRDGYCWVKALCVALFSSVGIYYDVAQFHDAVGGDVETCCLEVEEHDRFVLFHDLRGIFLASRRSGEIRVVSYLSALGIVS